MIDNSKIIFVELIKFMRRQEDLIITRKRLINEFFKKELHWAYVRAHYQGIQLVTGFIPIQADDGTSALYAAQPILIEYRVATDMRNIYYKLNEEYETKSLEEASKFFRDRLAMPAMVFR